MASSCWPSSIIMWWSLTPGASAPSCASSIGGSRLHHWLPTSPGCPLASRETKFRASTPPQVAHSLWIWGKPSTLRRSGHPPIGPSIRGNFLVSPQGQLRRTRASETVSEIEPEEEALLPRTGKVGLPATWSHSYTSEIRLTACRFDRQNQRDCIGEDGTVCSLALFGNFAHAVGHP